MAALFYRLSPHLVLSPREDPYEARPGERVLLLQSGKAFPLGHPSTRLSLELLREALAAVRVNRMLDLGCGTGVLGLAAAALGVDRVVGVDLSRPAARVTRENARANELAGLMQVVHGSTDCLKGPFDLVAANLPWEVQMDQAPELDRLASPHGRLLLSGFRDNQEALLLEQYRQRGWSRERRSVKPFHHPELPPDLSFTWVAWLLQKNS
jgi:ribosomal protein L11 methyltransferase